MSSIGFFRVIWICLAYFTLPVCPYVFCCFFRLFVFSGTLHCLVSCFLFLGHFHKPGYFTLSVCLYWSAFYFFASSATAQEGGKGAITVCNTRYLPPRVTDFSSESLITPQKDEWYASAVPTTLVGGWCWKDGSIPKHFFENKIES